MEITSEPAWLSAILSLGPTVVITTGALIALWWFREPISNRLGRVSRASTPVVSLDFAPEQSEPDAAISQTTAEAAKAVETEKSRPSGAQMSRWIPGSTPTALVGPEIAGFLNGTKPRSDLSDLACYWFFSWAFETTYRVSWGSQVRLLQALDTRGSMTRVEASGFYDSSRKAGNRGQTLDQYIDFLTSRMLVATTDGGKTFTPTPFGHQLVVYLATEKIPPIRPF